MIRANNVISAISNTTAPYTLAAAPTSLGALDLYTALSAQGYGTSQPIPVPLVLTEYTDATFATPKQKMGFFGGVTLNTSLATTTVAVTTVRWTQTALNTTSPSYAFNSPSAITVGNATYALIEIDATAETLLGCHPGVNVTDGDQWITPIGTLGVTQSVATMTSGLGYISAFMMGVPVLAKRMAIRIATGQVGGTGSLYFSLYARDSNGRAGKLLADYTGSTGVSLVVANGSYVSATVPNPPLLSPGVYFARIVPSFSGQSTTPAIATANYAFVMDGGCGVSGGYAYGGNYGGSPGAAPDPCGVTGINGFLPPIPYFRAS